MRPYLAILLDSFRFAMSSRVLLIVLALISILLVVAAPAGYEEQLTTELLDGDVHHYREFMLRVHDRGSEDGNLPESRIWMLLPVDLREDLEESAKLTAEYRESSDEKLKKAAEGKMPSRDEFLSALNQIIASSEFYSEATWPAGRLRKEADDLLESGSENLSEEQISRLNRILMESSFRGFVQRGPRTSMRFYYLTSDTGFVQPMRKEDLRELFVIFLPTILDSFVLSIGLLIAIIATAWLIPQTFEPGTLSLQLSKPIRRWLMFLAKFGGGCIFAAICSTYLFVGFWMLLGFRWGIWEHGLLLCIPLYVFVFAMYYSVSAIAALFWRSAIVSILVTGLFWGVCFVIGIAYGLMSGFLSIHENRTLATVGNDVIAVSNFNVPQIWNAEAREWQETLLTPEESRHVKSSSFPNLGEMIGPVELGPGRIALVRSTRKQGVVLAEASAAEQFKLDVIAKLPTFPAGLFRESDGNILIVNERGPFKRYRAKSDAGDSPRSRKDADVETAVLESVGPSADFVIESPAAVAQDADSDRVFVATGGRLHVYAQDAEGRYEKTLDNELPESPYLRVKLAANGDYLVVGRSDGAVVVLNAIDLAVIATHQPDGKNVVQQVMASPLGQWFAVRFANGNLWILDPGEDRMQMADIPQQGDVSAIAFTENGDLLVGDQSAHATQYSLESFEEVRECEPSRSFLENVYYYLVAPLHNYGPNPRVFDTTVQYVLSGKKSITVGRNGEEEKISPLRPVWCGTIFIILMLAIGCFYVERQEF